MDAVRRPYDNVRMTRSTPKQRRPTFIRQWRIHRGWTQEALAPRIGVSYATLGRVETGKLPYSQDHLENLAREFECSPADLLTINPMAGEVSALSLADRLGTLLRLYAPEKSFPPEAQTALAAALLGERYTPAPRPTGELPTDQRADSAQHED